MPFLNTYLNFEGSAEAAFNHYKSIFGGEFASFSRMSEIPSEAPLSEEECNKILHVALPVGEHCMLMGSDCPPSFTGGVQGNLFNISVSVESREEADRIFNALADGGTIIMPIADTFWNSYFGMTADKFGVQWMVGFDQVPA